MGPSQPLPAPGRKGIHTTPAPPNPARSPAEAPGLLGDYPAMPPFFFFPESHGLRKKREKAPESEENRGFAKKKKRGKRKRQNTLTIGNAVDMFFAGKKRPIVWPGTDGP